MQHDFDRLIDRSGTHSIKWERYGADVLPMWVADTDFAVAPAIVEAMRARLEHPLFGYTAADAGLREAIVAALAENFGWAVEPEQIVPITGVITGFQLALRLLLQPGEGLLVQTPVYPPILNAHRLMGLAPIQQALGADGAIDLEEFRALAARARAFLLCNPHNPLGRVFTREELLAMGEACLAAGATILSDEIHADITFDGRRHIPIASLSPELAARTITFMSATKTYNIAGLKAAFAVIPDPALRARFAQAQFELGLGVNIMGLEATRAAFAGAKAWKEGFVAAMQANRDWLAKAVRDRLPGITMRVPEGTYLAWLDCKALGLNEEAQAFFLREAKVGFNPGPEFGEAGRDFVRLNFGCPRATLEEGVARMEKALAARR